MIPDVAQKFNIPSIPGFVITVSRNMAYCFLFLFVFSCNTNSALKYRSSGTDTIPVLNIPQPQPISGPEFNRIKYAAEHWYDSALKPGNFNGAMLVAKNGNIIFERYNGTAHLRGGDTITENTALHIASVSKTFTAMGLLKLAQEGKVNLDDELSKYFPAFNYPGVTIRNLLSHRSGLPNYLYFMEELGWDKSVYIKNQDILDYLINRKAELKDITTPGTHFTYCNTNYALLALLIEKVTGLSYPQFIQQTFFIPLQMKNSFVCSMADTTRISPSYDWRGNLIPLNFLDLVYGDKNIYTTVRDLLTWDRALSGNVLFKKEILEEAYAPYSNERAGIRNYGLGWRMYAYPTGKKIIYHNGWWHGSNAAFIRVLYDSAVIILIGNKFNRNVYHAKSLASSFGEYGNAGDEEEMEALKNNEVMQSPVKKPQKIKAAKKRTRHTPKKRRK